MGNLYKEKLKSDDIAVFFGTYAPLHLGHHSEIIQAARKHNGVVVVTSGYKGDRGDKIGLPVEKRFRYLRESFSDNELVKVAMLKEDDLPRIPNGWSAWTKRLIKIVHANISNTNAKLTFYTGEKEYEEQLKKYISSKDKVVLVNRQLIPISATKIRENPIKYWNYIDRVYRRHFSKNILVAGAASSGKSTLIKDLARTFGSAFSEEYARYYQETFNVSDNELDVNDYEQLILGQYNANGKEINGTSNNGLVFCDTDAIVTQVYSDMWLNINDVSSLESLYADTVKKEKWDLILVVPPVSKFVDDNFRNMKNITNDDRWDFHKRLLKLLQYYNLMDKVRLLDAKSTVDDPQGFYARYLQAVQIIKDTTSFYIK